MSVDFALIIYPQGAGTPALKDMTSPAWGLVGVSKAATSARAPVQLLSVMIGMYRHAHRSPGAGEVKLLLWITSGQDLFPVY